MTRFPKTPALRREAIKEGTAVNGGGGETPPRRGAVCGEGRAGGAPQDRQPSRGVEEQNG